MTPYANTISPELSSPVELDEGDGVDFTHRIGGFSDDELRHLFLIYKHYFNLACAQPKVENFRHCVDAYDEFLAALDGGN